MHPGVPAILGAAGAALLAAAAAYGFVVWRGSEQERALNQKVAECRNGTIRSCDVLRDACNKKSGRACLHVGELHTAGAGVEKNPAEALRYYQLGCEAREVAACERACNLGAAAACARSKPQ